jgi:hypothetical protein
MKNAARHIRILLVFLMCSLAGTVAWGQPPQTVQQVRVQWTTAVSDVAPPPGQRANPLRLLARRSVAGSLPRQRNPQMSADQIFVQAVDARGRVVDSHLIPDPRLVRAEFPGPAGELSGEVLHRVDPDFLITLPNSPNLAELRLFQPRWTGTEFVLEPIGSIDLR